MLNHLCSQCMAMWMMAEALTGLTDAFLGLRYVGETGKNIEKVFAEVGGWVSMNNPERSGRHTYRLLYFYTLLHTFTIFIQQYILANDDWQMIDFGWFWNVLEEFGVITRHHSTWLSIMIAVPVVAWHLLLRPISNPLASASKRLTSLFWQQLLLQKWWSLKLWKTTLR